MIETQTVTVLDVPGSDGGTPHNFSYTLSSNAQISDLKILIEKQLGYPRQQQELMLKGSYVLNVDLILALRIESKQMLLLKVVDTPWLRFGHSCDSKTAAYYHIGLGCDFPIMESLFYNTNPNLIWTGTHFKKMKCWFRDKLLFGFDRRLRLSAPWITHIKNKDRCLFKCGTSIYIKSMMSPTPETLLSVRPLGLAERAPLELFP